MLRTWNNYYVNFYVNQASAQCWLFYASAVHMEKEVDLQNWLIVVGQMTGGDTLEKGL